MSFNNRFEPPTIDELDEESTCTYDKYCEGEFNCEPCKYNKGDE